MDKHGVGSYGGRESGGGAECSKTELLSVIERLKEKDMRRLVHIAALKHEIEALRSRL